MFQGAAEVERHQIQQALHSHRPRRFIVGFLDRDTATLVAKSWRVAKNQQVTRVKCRSNITDTAIKALANRCPNLTSIDLAGCTNITDTAITALATHCPNLTTIFLDGCTNITDTAKDSLRNKGIEVED